MSELAFIQKIFQDSMLHSGDALEDYVQGPSREFIKSRFKIYSEGYFIRLMQILEIDYPAVKKYLEPNVFNIISKDYVEKYPSSKKTLDYFGQFFPEHIRNHQLTNKNFALHDLARFELAFNQLSISKSFTRISVDDLKKIPGDNWGKVVFNIHSSHHVLKLDFDIPENWKSINSNNETPNFSPYIESKYWILCNQLNDINYQFLNSIQLKMYHLILQGKTYGELCDALIGTLEEENIPEVTLLTLLDWIEIGLISSLNQR